MKLADIFSKLKSDLGNSPITNESKSSFKLNGSVSNNEPKNKLLSGLVDNELEKMSDKKETALQEKQVTTLQNIDVDTTAIIDQLKQSNKTLKTLLEFFMINGLGGDSGGIDLDLGGGKKGLFRKLATLAADAGSAAKGLGSRVLSSGKGLASRLPAMLGGASASVPMVAGAGLVAGGAAHAIHENLIKGTALDKLDVEYTNRLLAFLGNEQAQKYIEHIDNEKIKQLYEEKGIDGTSEIPNAPVLNNTTQTNNSSMLSTLMTAFKYMPTVVDSAKTAFNKVQQSQLVQSLTNNKDVINNPALKYDIQNNDSGVVNSLTNSLFKSNSSSNSDGGMQQITTNNPSSFVQKDSNQINSDITKLISTAGEKTRVYEKADGSVETWKGGSASWRNRNPGNLKFEYAGSSDKSVKTKRTKEAALAKAQSLYEGVVDLDQFGNAVFKNEEAGTAAKIKLLTGKHGNKTIEEMLPKYAMNDYSGKADHQAYANKIHSTAEKEGLNLRGKKISELNNAELTVLAKGMRQMEGWKAGDITVNKPPSFQTSNVTSNNQNNTSSFKGVGTAKLLPESVLNMRVKYDGTGKTKTIGELGIKSYEELQSKGGQAFAGGYNDPSTVLATSLVQKHLGDNFGYTTAVNDEYHQRYVKKSGHTKGNKSDFTVKGISYKEGHQKTVEALGKYGLMEGEDYKLKSTPHGTAAHIDMAMLQSGKDKISKLNLSPSETVASSDVVKNAEKMFTKEKETTKEQAPIVIPQAQPQQKSETPIDLNTNNTDSTISRLLERYFSNAINFN